MNWKGQVYATPCLLYDRIFLSYSSTDVESLISVLRENSHDPHLILQACKGLQNAAHNYGIYRKEKKKNTTCAFVEQPQTRRK